MIRTATLSDRPHFLRLWAEFLAEQEKEGSYVLATTNNLYHILETFESYVTGGTDGFCIFWEIENQPVAVALAGYFTGLEGWETSLGRVATLWGVYVQPSQRGRGISLKLFAHGVEVGKELGFDTLETHVRSDNTHGLRAAKASGLTTYLQQHLVSLRDPKILDNDEAREKLGRGVGNE